jgi:HEAT repeat protein
MMSRKKHIFLWVFLALVLVVAGSMLIPTIRVRVLGLFRGEPFFDGLPASAWSQKLHEEKLQSQPGERGPVFDQLKKGGKAVLPVLMEIAFPGNSPGREEGQLLLLLQGETAVPPLVKALKKPAIEDRKLATVILGSIGGKAKPAVATLVRMLDDAEGQIRVAAIVALQQIGSDEAVPDLIQILEGKGTSTNPDWLAEAAKALGKIGPQAKSAVPALIACLKAPDPRLNLEACLALAQIGKDSLPAVPDLIAILKNPKSSARASAMLALGQIGPGAKQAVPVLIGVLEEGDATLRETAKDALARMGAAAASAVPALLGYFGDKAPIQEIGPAAIPELIKLLPGPDRDGKGISGNWLKKFGKAATPALLEALAKDKDPIVRRAVATMLRGSNWGEAKDVIPGLIAVLGDMHRRIAEEAAVSILSFRQEAQPFLEEAVRGKNQTLRLESVQLLGKLGLSGKSSTKLLLSLLKDEDPAFRLATIRALGNMNVHPKEAVPILLDALKSKNQTIWIMPQLAIHGRGAKEAVPLLAKILLEDPDWKMRRLAAYSLARIGADRETMLPALKKALGDKHEMVRAEAAEALGGSRFAADELVPLLTKLLEDKSPEVQAGAIAGLGQLGKAAKSAVPLISKIAKTSEEMPAGRMGRDLRSTCVIAFGNIGPAAKEAAPLLLSWLPAAKSEETRLDIMQSLGQIQATEAAKVLRPLVRTGKGYEGIVAALAWWRIEQAPEALAFLEQGLTAKSGRGAYIEAIGKIGAPARKSVPALIKILQRDKDLDQRALAAEALGRIGAFARPAIKSLIESLRTPHAGMRIQAALALAQFDEDAKDAVPRLLPLLDDPESPELRQAAADALQRIDPDALRP